MLTDRKVIVPPIKCQGKKTKLVPWILKSIHDWDEQKGTWIEPFFGSGVVGINVHPKKANVSDNNEHIVRLYKDIQNGLVNPDNVDIHLRVLGEHLEKSHGETYYDVRSRFNQNHESLDFLFLNRSCFNGVMRFNNKGEFNVPFCKNPQRFSKSYITKICNQVRAVWEVFQESDWSISHRDWRDALDIAETGDMVYMDPPYLGLNTRYHSDWEAWQEEDLQETMANLPCNFAYSTWLAKRGIQNPVLLQMDIPDTELKTHLHRYQVGQTRENRPAVEEALVIRMTQD